VRVEETLRMEASGPLYSPRKAFETGNYRNASSCPMDGSHSRRRSLDPQTSSLRVLLWERYMIGTEPASLEGAMEREEKERGI